MAANKSLCGNFVALRLRGDVLRGAKKVGGRSSSELVLGSWRPGRVDWAFPKKPSTAGRKVGFVVGALLRLALSTPGEMVRPLPNVRTKEYNHQFRSLIGSPGRHPFRTMESSL